MIRVVIDTNIIISALFWGGLPRAVIDAVLDRKCASLVTEAITAELARVLAYPKFAEKIAKQELEIQRLIADYLIFAVPVIPAAVPPGIVRDPKDRAILGCAVGGKADFVVSGDKDLLVLHEYENIPIMSAETFLHSLSAE